MYSRGCYNESVEVLIREPRTYLSVEYSIVTGHRHVCFQYRTKAEKILYPLKAVLRRNKYAGEVWVEELRKIKAFNCKRTGVFLVKGAGGEGRENALHSSKL